MSGVLSTTAGRRRDGIPSQLIEMFRAVFVDNSAGFGYVVPAPLVLGESYGRRCQPTAAARPKPTSNSRTASSHCKCVGLQCSSHFLDTFATRPFHIPHVATAAARGKPMTSTTPWRRKPAKLQNYAKVEATMQTDNANMCTTHAHTHTHKRGQHRNALDPCRHHRNTLDPHRHNRNALHHVRRLVHDLAAQTNVGKWTTN